MKHRTDGRALHPTMGQQGRAKATIILAGRMQRDKEGWRGGRRERAAVARGAGVTAASALPVRPRLLSPIAWRGPASAGKGTIRHQNFKCMQVLVNRRAVTGFEAVGSGPAARVQQVTSHLLPSVPSRQASTHRHVPASLPCAALPSPHLAPAPRRRRHHEGAPGAPSPPPQHLPAAPPPPPQPHAPPPGCGTAQTPSLGPGAGLQGIWGRGGEGCGRQVGMRTAKAPRPAHDAGQWRRWCSTRVPGLQGPGRSWRP